MEPVADESHGRGGGVGVRGRRRRRGGDGVGLHAGAEEDGERLRYVLSCHVTRPSVVVAGEAAEGRRQGRGAGGCVLAGGAGAGAAVPTFAVGFGRWTGKMSVSVF